MSKLAVVFNGIIGGDADRNGYGNPIDFVSCAKTIKHNIITPNSADVFIHSWSIDQKDNLVDIYKPKKYLFEPQEMFGYSLNEEERVHPNIGQAFRATSHYISVKRGLDLVYQYEIEHNFKYDWLLIIRFDYIILTQLHLNNLDPNNMYVVYEPHWPDIVALQKIYDGLFLSSRELAAFFTYFGDEILTPEYTNLLADIHTVIYTELIHFLGHPDKIKYVYERFKDIEIWRCINNPKLNQLGFEYGILDTKERTMKLLERIKI